MAVLLFRCLQKLFQIQNALPIDKQKRIFNLLVCSSVVNRHMCPSYHALYFWKTTRNLAWRYREHLEIININIGSKTNENSSAVLSHVLPLSLPFPLIILTSSVTPTATLISLCMTGCLSFETVKHEMLLFSLKLFWMLVFSLLRRYACKSCLQNSSHLSKPFFLSSTVDISVRFSILLMNLGMGLKHGFAE